MTDPAAVEPELAVQFSARLISVAEAPVVIWPRRRRGFRKLEMQRRGQFEPTFAQPVVENMAAGAAVLRYEVQVIAGHADADRIVRTTETKDRAADVEAFKLDCLQRQQRLYGFSWRRTLRNRTGRSAGEAHRVEQIGDCASPSSPASNAGFSMGA